MFLWLADFFSKSTFSKNSFREASSLNPDHAQHFVGQIWVQTVYKDYQWMTLGYSKQRVKMTEYLAHICHDMGFPTMWYVRPAKPQISLLIRAV